MAIDPITHLERDDEEEKKKKEQQEKASKTAKNIIKAKNANEIAQDVKTNNTLGMISLNKNKSSAISKSSNELIQSSLNETLKDLESSRAEGKDVAKEISKANTPDTEEIDPTSVFKSYGDPKPHGSTFSLDGVDFKDYAEEFGGFVFDPEKNYEASMARKQGWAWQTGKALAGGITKGLLTLAEGLTYAGDLENWFVAPFSDEVDAWEENWLASIINEGKEGVEDFTKIYRQDRSDVFDWNDWGFYMDSFKGVLDSAIGYGGLGLITGGAALPLVTAARMGAAAGRLGKLGKAAKLANRSKRFGKYMNAIQKSSSMDRAIASGSSALLTNYVEGKVMGVELHDDVMRAALEAGESPEDAKAAADEAAKDFLLKNRIFILTDYFAMRGMFKGKGFTRGAQLPEAGAFTKAGLKASAKKNLLSFTPDNLILQGAKESAEELGQYAFQSADTEQAKQRLGIIDPEMAKQLEGKTPFEQYQLLFADALTESQGHLEAFMGFWGGGVQRAMQNVVTGKYNPKNRSKEDSNLAANAATVESTQEFIKSFMKSTIKEQQAVDLADKQGDEMGSELAKKGGWYKNLMQNFLRGTTDHVDQFLVDIIEGNMDPKILEELGGKEAQAKAEELRDELLELEDQYLRDSGYKNQGQVFATRLNQKLQEERVDYLNHKKNEILNGTDTEKGAIDTIDVLAKAYAYKDKETGETVEISYSLDNLLDPGDNNKEVYDKFLSEAIKSPQVSNLLILNGLLKQAEDKNTELFKDLVFQQTKAGEKKFEKDIKKAQDDQNYQDDLKENTQEDIGATDIVAGDFVSVKDQNDQEVFGKYLGTTETEDGREFYKIDLNGTIKEYPSGPFTLTKRKKSQSASDTKEDGRRAAEVANEPETESDIETIAQKLADSNFNVKSLTPDELQVYKENTNIISNRANAILGNNVGTSIQQQSINNDLSNLKAQLEANLAPLMAEKTELEKKKNNLEKGIKRIDKQLEDPNNIAKGSDDYTKLMGRRKGFKKNLVTIDKAIKVLDKEIKEIDRKYEQIVDSNQAVPTKGQTLSEIAAAAGVKTSTGKKAAKAISKVIQNTVNPASNDPNPGITLAIQPEETESAESIQVAWRSDSDLDPEDEVALEENTAAVTAILEDPNQSVVGMNVELAIDPMFMSEAQKKKLGGASTLTEAEINSLPVAQWWLDENGNRTGLRTWIHNENFDEFKNKDAEIAALRAIRKEVYARYNSGIPLIQTVIAEGHGGLNTVEQDLPIQEVFGDDVKLLYRGDMGMFFYGVKNGKQKEDIEYDHVANEDKQQGGIYIRGIKSAKGQLIPIKTNHITIGELSQIDEVGELEFIGNVMGELIYEMSLALTLDRKSFMDDVKTSKRVMDFLNDPKNSRYFIISGLLGIKENWKFRDLMNFIINNGDHSGPGPKFFKISSSQIMFGENKSKKSDSSHFFLNINKDSRYYMLNPNMKDKFIRFIKSQRINITRNEINNPKAISYWSQAGILTTNARPLPNGQFFKQPIINTSSGVAVDKKVQTSKKKDNDSTSVTTSTEVADTILNESTNIDNNKGKRGYKAIHVRTGEKTHGIAYGKPFSTGLEQMDEVPLYAVQLRDGKWGVIDGRTGKPMQLRADRVTEVIKAATDHITKMSPELRAQVFGGSAKITQLVVKVDGPQKGQSAIDALLNINPEGGTDLLNDSPTIDTRYREREEKTDKYLEEGNSPSKLLNTIRANTSNPLLLHAANLLGKSSEVLKANLITLPLDKFATARGVSMTDALKKPAFYDTKTNTIYFNKDVAERLTEEEVQTVILHEMYHASTGIAFASVKEGIGSNRDIEFVDTMRALWSKFKGQASDLRSEYGFTNVEEFTAEFYINPAFREKIYQKDSNFFKRIWNAIRKFFGFSPVQSQILKRGEQAIASYITRTDERQDTKRALLKDRAFHDIIVNPMDRDIIEGYGEDEILELTNAMTKILFTSAKVTNIKDFESLSGVHKDVLSKTGLYKGPVFNTLVAQAKKLHAANDPRAVKLAEIVTNSDLYGRFYEEMKLRLESLYGIIMNDEIDVEEKAEGKGDIGVKPHFEINWRDNATTNTKLLVAFAPYKDEEGNKIIGDTFGLPLFANFKSTWDTLLQNLADIHEPENTEDSLQPMIDKIKTLVPYKSHLSYFVDYLTNTKIPSYKHTEFFNAFSMNKIPYTSSIYEVGDDGVITYKIGESDSMGNLSTEQTIREFWSDSMMSKLSYTDAYGQAYLKSITTDNIVREFRTFKDSYRALFGGGKPVSDADFAKVTEDLHKILKKTGIEVNPRVFDFMAHDLFDGNKTKALREFVMIWFSRLYSNANREAIGGGYSLDAISNKSTDDEGNSIPIEAEMGMPKTALLTEESMKLFARYALLFNEDITENMVPGAGGNRYWKYSKNSFMTRFLVDLKNDPSLVDKMLEMPLYQNSQLLRYIKERDPEDQAEVNMMQYNSMTAEGESKEYTKLGLADDIVDRANRILTNLGPKGSGFFPFVNTADKSRHYNLIGPETIRTGIRYIQGNEGEGAEMAQGWDFSNKSAYDALNMLAGHVIDELTASNLAFEQIRGELLDGPNLLPSEEHVLHFHYKEKINEETGEITKVYKDEKGKPIGKWATLSTLPSLSFGTKQAENLGLYKTTGQPFIPTQKTRQLIVNELKRVLTNQLDKHMKFVAKSSDPNIIQSSVLNKYYNSPLEAHADVVFNSIFWNIEMTKLFVGDPRFYKSMADVKKRIPATIASGADLRIYKNKKMKIIISDPGDEQESIIEKGDWEVNPDYLRVVLAEVIKPSDYFNYDAVENIAKAIMQDGYNEKEAIKRAKALIDGYQEIDITDAQGWITFDRAVEILKGLGKWTDEHEANKDKIYNGSATPKMMDLFMKPFKGVHYELRETGGMLVPTYTKYSASVLLPVLTAGNDLDNLRVALEEQEKKKESKGRKIEAIVVEGIKAGITDITQWIGPDNKVLSKDKMIFNPISLSNKHWKLQQDLPDKGMKATLVGSQIKKNIIANIDLNREYAPGIFGKDIIREINEVDITLSNEGARFIADKFNYDTTTDTYLDNGESLREWLVEEMKDQPRMFRQALQNGLPFDAMPFMAEKIESKLTSAVNAKTVKLKQLGGSYIQQSAQGFIPGSTKIPDWVRDQILWINKKKPAPLRVVRRNDEGKQEIVLIRPGQVLLPHKIIKQLEELFPEASKEELLKKVDKRILEGVGYRIPNQANSSNDAINIVGILPEWAGDTIVIYEEITTKTGSDFDIDKMYVMMPEYYTDKEGAKFIEYSTDMSQGQIESRYKKKWAEFRKTNRLKKILSEVDAEQAELEEDAKLSKEDVKKEGLKRAINVGIFPTIEEFAKLPIMQQNSIKAIQNRRIELYRTILTHPSKFEEIMTPLDADDVKNSIVAVSPETDVSEDLDFYTFKGQLQDKHNFIGGKFGVGLTANQLVDAALTQYANIHIPSLAASRVPGWTEDGEFINSFDLTKSKDTKGRLISHIISAYLNAYVDIAKDPYIVKGNHNLKTANTVFMLLRAGVPFEWVNAFVSQPIIRDYVALSSSKDNATMSSFVPVNKILKEMYADDFNNYKEAQKKDTFKGFPMILEKDLKHSANPDMNEGNPVNQWEVLDLFKTLRDDAKELSDSVLASKADTVGAGKNLLDSYLIASIIDSVYNNDTIRNFSEKFHNTALGAFTANSIGLANRMFKDLFIYNNDSFRDAMDSISQEIRGKRTYEKIEVAEAVRRELYNAFLANSFHLSVENRNELFYGKNNIAQQLRKLKGNKEYEKNSLIKALRYRLRFSRKSPNGTIINKAPSTVSFKNLRGVANMSVEQLQRDWLALYESEDEAAVKFAKDLIYTAYFQAGARTRSASFTQLIPPYILVDMGISQEIMNSAEDLSANPHRMEALKAQVIQHIYTNPDVVPHYQNSRRNAPMKTISGNITLDEGFYLLYGNIGNDKDGEKVYPKFITRVKKIKNERTEEWETIKQLHEYVGNTSKARVKDGQFQTDRAGNKIYDRVGVFRRVASLGYDNKGVVMNEYVTKPNIVVSKDNKRTVVPHKSLINENNIVTNTIAQQNIQALIDKGNDTKANEFTIQMPGPIDEKSISAKKIKEETTPKTPADKAVDDLIKYCKGK